MEIDSPSRDGTASRPAAIFWEHTMHDWNEDCPPPWADDASVPVSEQIEREITRVRKRRFEIPCSEDAEDDKPFYPLT